MGPAVSAGGVSVCVDLGESLGGRTSVSRDNPGLGRHGGGLRWGIVGDSVLLKRIDGEGGKEEGEGGELFDIGRGGGIAAWVNASCA